MRWWKCSQVNCGMGPPIFEYAKKWIVDFKWVYYMVCELYLNKAVGGKKNKQTCKKYWSLLEQSLSLWYPSLHGIPGNPLYTYSPLSMCPTPYWACSVSLFFLVLHFPNFLPFPLVHSFGGLSTLGSWAL